LYLIIEVQLIKRRDFCMKIAKDLNPEIINHLKIIASKYGQDSEEYLDSLIKAWIKKEKIFMKQVKSLHMTIESSISANEKRAFIALTFSGSILGVGPASSEGNRQVIYASVGLRKEVPDRLLEENLTVKGAVELDKEIIFKGGSLKKSSPVYKIALMKDELPQKQNQQIEDATKIMTKEFVSINNTIVPE